ncbi:phosphorylase family protein [Alkalihalobacterium bogoriense]|uniref:phosphorylase family protein n=1 Tax=Alkalihalobacterium bogoriense TaxID=246272 RepID=UPI000479A2AB|nr:hypothetical protein [Alkalihalobacterium bogoriense]
MAVTFCEKENIKKWSQDGYLGVEMECGTTFAVCASFTKRAIGLFQVSDQIIHGDSVLYSNEEKDFIKSATNEVIRRLALHLTAKG